MVIVDALIATGGTAIACAQLINESFGVAFESILVLALIDLPALGGSELIRETGSESANLIAH